MIELFPNLWGWLQFRDVFLNRNNLCGNYRLLDVYLKTGIGNRQPDMKPRFNYFKAPDVDDEQNRHIVFYCEWGDPQNKDVVVCVHGLSRNARDFDYLAAALADKYRVICVDIVGRGKSEWLEDKSRYDYTTYVDDILKLLKHLDINKVDWVGTSMGGIIGMIVAGRYPDLIKKMVLNDIGPIIPGDAIARILKNAASKHEFRSSTDAEKALRNKMSTFGITNEEHWKHVIKHGIVKKLDSRYCFAYDPEIIPPRKIYNKIRAIIATILCLKRRSGYSDIDLMDIWDKVSCPLLALRGKLSDVVNDDVVGIMRSSNKDIKIVELDDVGHAPMLMEEEQIKVVHDWLTERK